MKTLLLTIVIIGTIVAISHAQESDTTMVNMMDKIADRAFIGLEKFAQQSGMAIESAWPYAMQYVGAKRTIYFWIGMIAPISLVGFILLFIYGIKKSETRSDLWGSDGYEIMGYIGATLGLIDLIVNFVWLFEIVPDYLLFKYAPEAATIEYLLTLI